MGALDNNCSKYLPPTRRCPLLINIHLHVAGGGGGRGLSTKSIQRQIHMSRRRQPRRESVSGKVNKSQIGFRRVPLSLSPRTNEITEAEKSSISNSSLALNFNNFVSSRYRRKEKSEFNSYSRGSSKNGPKYLHSDERI